MFLRRSGFRVPALLAAAGLAAYARSFTVPFQFDDVRTLVQASRVHLTHLDWESLWPMLSYYRPLAQLSFGLNYWLGGLAPAGWHAVNLAVHIAAATFAWLLSRELLARAGWGDEARRARVALVAALIFLLHPVQTQAVTYIVQRMTSMAGCLGLLAAWLWLRGRRSARPGPWLAGAGAAWLAAVLTKESTILLPAVIAGAEALFGEGLPAWLRHHRRAVLVSVAAMGALGIGMGARYWSYIQSENARFGLSLGERLLTQPRVIAHYLSLLVWPLPSRLRVDYSFSPSRGLLEPPTTVLALTALGLLVLVAWWLRQRQPLVSFGVLWFLGNLVVENSVLPVDLVFEHRLYLPSFGLFLLAAVGLDRVLGAWPTRVWATALPALFLLGIATDRRNAAWNDPAALHAQVLADAPDNPRPLMTIGSQAMARGDVDAAERAFRAVLALDPTDPGALTNMGSVARARGDFVQAERWYREALASANLEAAALEGLGVVLSEQGRSVEAEQQFQKLVAMDARNVRALANLGTLRARLQDRAGALDWFARAVAADPSDPYPQIALGKTRFAFGQWAEALAAAEQALKLDPHSGEALELRADCLEQLGRAQEVLAAWQKVLEAEPARRSIHFKIGTALAQVGDLAGAERELEAELALGPHSGALNNLGNVWLGRDPVRARGFYQRALQVDPGNTLAAENLRRLSAPGP